MVSERTLYRLVDYNLFEARSVADIFERLYLELRPVRFMELMPVRCALPERLRRTQPRNDPVCHTKGKFP